MDALFHPCAQPTLLCHPILLSAVSGIGFSTDFPSPTPFGLGLGPGLLWADDPSPENLRLSAGRILTCLFAYSYRHSHLYALHYSFQYSFCAHTTLPYHLGGITTGFSPWGAFCRKSLYLFLSIFATKISPSSQVLNTLVIPPKSAASVPGLAPLHFRRRAT